MSSSTVTGAKAGVSTHLTTLEPLPRGPLGNLIPPKYQFEPVTIGPTWEKNEEGEFVLPRYTLGWQAIKWAEDNLMSDDNDGTHWKFTPEQRRFVLWLYEVDEMGEFTTRVAILQRLKGWCLG